MEDLAGHLKLELRGGVKRYKLLVAWGVVVQLRRFPTRVQQKVYALFERLEHRA